MCIRVFGLVGVSHGLRVHYCASLEDFGEPSVATSGQLEPWLRRRPTMRMNGGRSRTCLGSGDQDTERNIATQKGGITFMSPRTLCSMVAGLALLLVGVGTSTAAPPPKVDICHFQEDEGTWKKISVGGNARTAHFANHDDVDPNGTTSTGTQLDADCHPVASCQPVEGISCGNCLATGHGKGCENCACQTLVCLTDPVCCSDDGHWDGLCASEALAACSSGDSPVCTGEPACGSCVAPGSDTNCESEFPNCYATVCAADPTSFCCSAWDATCMALAFDLCEYVGSDKCIAP